MIRVLKMNKTPTLSTWEDKFSGKLTLTKKFKKFIYPNVISTYLIRKKVSLIIYSYFFLNSIMRIEKVCFRLLAKGPLLVIYIIIIFFRIWRVLIWMHLPGIFLVLSFPEHPHRKRSIVTWKLKLYVDSKL